MTISDQDVGRWAEYLDGGLREGKELDRISSSFPGLTVEDGYRIQAQGLTLRVKRAEKVIGLKMGLTSKAKREQMGLHSPVYGVLTDAMQVRGTYSLKGQIHPKIEPEVAFLILRELRGAVTAEQVLESCGGLCAAMEILDSRYTGFKYFSLPDVVADNSSSSQFVLGEWVRDFRALPLDRLEMSMKVDGVEAQRALSAEISGHPVHSVVQLCELLAREGKSLPAGSIVLAGAATVAVPLVAGQTIRLDVGSLPSVEISITA